MYAVVSSVSMKATVTKVGKRPLKKPSAQRKKEKSPEEALNALNARCTRQEERLESLTTKHEMTLKERDVLTYIVHQTQMDSTGEGLHKTIIECQDVYTFMEHASQAFDRLQHRMHITLRYAWFCQWLCTKYSIRRQRGGAGGAVLSACTVLSYFKRERAGG